MRGSRRSAEGASWSEGASWDGDASWDEGACWGGPSSMRNVQGSGVVRCGAEGCIGGARSRDDVARSVCMGDSGAAAFVGEVSTRPPSARYKAFHERRASSSSGSASNASPGRVPRVGCRKRVGRRAGSSLRALRVAGLARPSTSAGEASAGGVDWRTELCHSSSRSARRDDAPLSGMSCVRAYPISDMSGIESSCVRGT